MSLSSWFFIPLFHVSLILKYLGPSGSRPQGRNFNIYVPSDERFSPNKLKEIKSNSIHAIVQCLSSNGEPLPQRSSRSFQSFDEILDMFSSNRSQTIMGWIRDNLKKLVPVEHLKEMTLAIKENYQQFHVPQIISGKKLWRKYFRYQVTSLVS